jgi:hypothetical protein
LESEFSEIGLKGFKKLALLNLDFLSWDTIVLEIWEKSVFSWVVLLFIGMSLKDTELIFSGEANFGFDLDLPTGLSPLAIGLRVALPFDFSIKDLARWMTFIDSLIPILAKLSFAFSFVLVSSLNLLK